MLLHRRLRGTRRPVIAVFMIGLIGSAYCTRDRLLGPGEQPDFSAVPTTDNLKVAFLGDQGDGTEAAAVLQLVRAEGADMVLHQGDFDYSDNPTNWDANITNVLGASFPYFASVGNHDVPKFYGPGGYQEKLQQRLSRVTGATCTGDLGVNSACRYQGLFFVLSGVGTLGTGHDAYLRQQLTSDNSVWRICSWHKNQRAMQVGGKSDEVGWAAYETCRELGAIIATAHEHSYERTRTLISMTLQTVDPVWNGTENLRVAPGATFVFVSGMAGQSIRDQERCLPTTFPYGCNGEWATIYTSNQGAKEGALFVDFHVDGDPNKARGYFKTLDGQIVDQFTIVAQPAEPPPNEPPVAAFAQSCSGLTCSFTDQSTDSDGTVAGWSWSFGDNTTSTTQHPSHTYTAGGTYTVAVTVTDDDGAVTTASRSITVTEPPSNQPPTAAFTESCSGLTCSFTDQSTDTDGSVAAWSWSFGDNATSTTQHPSHTYTAGGTYTVAVTVADDDGATSTTSRSITITAPPPNQPPTAAFTESCSGLTCSFTDQSTDGDGSVVSWSWSFGDNTTSTQRHPSKTYTAGGTYTVTLTVTDEDGAEHAASHSVTVTAPPVVVPVVSACNPDGSARNTQLIVQVTGSNLQAGATVSFGEAIAVQRTTFVSASRLDVRVRVHAKAPLGARAVTVTNPDGRSGTLAGCFTVR